MKNNKIKAVFFDIDGTFYDHKNNQVHKKTIETCEALRKNGYRVALCSGRPKEMADELHVFELMQYDGYIGSSGGIAMDENFNVIYQNIYSKEQLTQIFDIAKKRNLCLFSFGKYNFMTQPLNEVSERLILDYHLTYPEVRDWKGEMLSAVSVIGNEDDFQQFDEIEGITYTSSTPYCIDFVKKGVNKDDAIRAMMKFWNLPEDDYMVFGDSHNDIKMIQNAKISVAMGNAVDEIKKAADIIAKDCSDENCIYDVVKELGMI